MNTTEVMADAEMAGPFSDTVEQYLFSRVLRQDKDLLSYR